MRPTWSGSTTASSTSARAAPEKELQVEKEIFSLNGDVTKKLKKAKPFVFGMNKG